MLKKITVPAVLAAASFTFFNPSTASATPWARYPGNMCPASQINSHCPPGSNATALWDGVELAGPDGLDCGYTEISCPVVNGDTHTDNTVTFADVDFSISAGTFTNSNLDAYLCVYSGWGLTCGTPTTGTGSMGGSYPLHYGLSISDLSAWTHDTGGYPFLVVNNSAVNTSVEVLGTYFIF